MELVWWTFILIRFFWTTTPGYSLGHSLFLRPRWLYWAWCRCAHLEFPSPSWQTSGSLWGSKGQASWSPLHGCTCGCSWCYSLVTTSLIRTALLLLATLLCGATMPGPGGKERAWGIVGGGRFLINVDFVVWPECFPPGDFNIFALLKQTNFFNSNSPTWNKLLLTWVDLTLFRIENNSKWLTCAGHSHLSKSYFNTTTFPDSWEIVSIHKEKATTHKFSLSKQH